MTFLGGELLQKINQLRLVPGENLEDVRRLVRVGHKHLKHVECLQTHGERERERE